MCYLYLFGDKNGVCEKHRLGQRCLNVTLEDFLYLELELFFLFFGLLTANISL